MVPLHTGVPLYCVPIIGVIYRRAYIQASLYVVPLHTGVPTYCVPRKSQNTDEAGPQLMSFAQFAPFFL